MNDSTRTSWPWIAGLFAFTVLLVLQVNLPPLERYPNWDAFWVDTMTVGNLALLKQAFLAGELPVINPFVNMGWKVLGDTTLGVSPFNPVNWLVLVFSPAAVIQIRTILMMAMGAIGAFVYLRHVTKSDMASFFAGALYLALPMNFTLIYQTNMLAFVYATPFFLFLVHRIYEGARGSWFWLFALSFFSTTLGDVYTLIAMPFVLGTYGLMAGKFVCGSTFLRAVRTTFFIGCVWFLAGLPVIVPFLENILANGSLMAELRAAGVLGDTSVSLDAVRQFMANYAYCSTLVPTDSASIILYLPAGFYAMALVLLFMKEGRASPALRLTGILALTALVLMLETFLFYSIPALSKHSTGLLRVQFKLFSFLMLMGATIAIVVMASLLKRWHEQGEKEKTTKALKWMGVAGLATLATDAIMFMGPSIFACNGRSRSWFRAVHDVAMVPSSVAVPFPQSLDLWFLLPVFNLLLVAAFMAVLAPAAVVPARYAWLRGMLGRKAAVALVLALLAIFYASLHVQLRERQIKWAWSVRDDYRISAYENRMACLAAKADVSDIRYRTLYTAYANPIMSTTGARNWKNIAETEMAPVYGVQSLFSYRNTMQPYLGLVRSVFDTKQSRFYDRNNHWPPLVDTMVPANLSVLRFAGIRWIVSSNARLPASMMPYVKALGTCESPSGPLDLPEELSGGPVFVYELKNPESTVRLVDKYEVVSPADTAKRLYEGGSAAFSGKTVWLDSAPDMPEGRANVNNEVRMTRLASSEMDVSVSTARPRMMVLSHLYYPAWKAEIDGKPVRVHRAYGGFMAVPVPAGVHDVTFRYDASYAWLGLWLSLGVGGILLAAALVRRKP